MNPLSPSESIVRPYRVPASKEGRGLGSGSNRVQDPRDSEKTAVYKIHNRDDELIYVGLSCRPTRRMLQHLDDKSWHHEIARIDVTWYEDRPTAENAERFYIRMHRPRHNTIYKPDEPYRWPDPQPCPRCSRPTDALSHSWRDNKPAQSKHFCEDCELLWVMP